jgi:hypothetical protein
VQTQLTRLVARCAALLVFFLFGLYSRIAVHSLPFFTAVPVAIHCLVDGVRAHDVPVTVMCQVEELRIELSALRHLVRLKNKELRTLRRLSETILSQRSEVEAFFLEALDQVKQEIRNRALATKRATQSLRSLASGSVRFPAIKDSGSPTGHGGTGGGLGLDDTKVELKDLSLEVRSRSTC